MATALYSPVEAKLLDFISDRLESWRATLQAHINSFTELAGLEKQVQSAYLKIANEFDIASLKTIAPGSHSHYYSYSASAAQSKDDGPRPVNPWTKPWHEYASQCSAMGEASAQYICETILPQIYRLQEGSLKKNGKLIKASLNEAKGKLTKSHEALLAAMNQHEKAWELRMRLGQEGPRLGNGEESKALSEAVAAVDVFLTEQQMKQKIEQYLNEKSEFCTLILRQFDALRTLELDLAVGLRSILSEHLKMTEIQLNKRLETLISSLDVIRLSEPLVEWQCSLRAHQLDWEWQASAPPFDGLFISILTQIGISLSSSHDPSLVNRVKILKSGYLMRPSTFTRSSLVIYCVLTDSSFLHCYSIETLLKAGENGSKKVRVPNSSMNLHRRALSELNANAISVWCDATGNSIDVISQCAPSISIPLLHPETIVVPEQKGVDKFVFSITVPAGSGLLGRGEKKYQLRSFVEEDMVDWCIAIKDVIKSNEQSARATPLLGTPVKSSEKSFNSPITVGKGEELLFEATVASYETPLGNYNISHEMAGEYSHRTSSPLPDLENPWDSQ